jgi:hypothetical protein
MCVLLAASTGCSPLFVRPTPRADAAHPDAPPACTRSWGVFPLVDAGAAIGILGLTSFAVGLNNGLRSLDPACDTGQCKRSSDSSGYVLAGLFAASAVYGLLAGGSCEAQVARERELRPAPAPPPASDVGPVQGEGLPPRGPEATPSGSR